MLRTLAITAAICFAFSFSINAQTSAPTTTQSQSPEISAEKRALVKELVDVIGVRASANEMLNVIVNQIQNQTVEMMWKTLSQMKEMDVLTEGEQKDLKTKVQESAQRQTKRFVDSLNHRVDFAQLTEDVSISVYGKYFNEKELKDLIAFYKSDTGKRSVQVTPNLMAESMSQAAERLIPLMDDITRDIANDGTDKLRNEVTELAKSHHKRATTNRKTTRKKG